MKNRNGKRKLYVVILAGILALTGCAGADKETEAEAETSQTESESYLSYVDYVASDYIVLGDYKNLNIDESEITVPEDELESTIDTIMKYYEETEEVTDRGIEEGDLVNITSHGYDGNKEVETLKAYSFEIIIGEGTFGLEYEYNLIGAETGDTVEFDVYYDEDYDSENIAGKTIHYEVKINMIARYIEEELTDEYITELSDGQYATVEEFREGCEEYLMDENGDAYLLNTAKEKLLNESEILGYPEEALQQNVEELRGFYEENAKYAGMELDEYLEAMTGLEGEEADEVLVQMAEDTLAEEMMMKALAEAEGIELTQEEYESYVEDYVTSEGYDMTLEEMELMFGEENLKEAFTLRKTEQYFLDLLKG